MARIRSVHPGIFTDEGFVSCSPLARLLVIGLWTDADDQGVFEWKPVSLKMRLLPMDAADVAELLQELSTHNLIQRFFGSDGRSYGAIRNFRRYQRPKFPKHVHFIPPELLPYVGLSQAATPGAPRMEEEGGAEEEGEEGVEEEAQGETGTPPATGALPPSPPVLVFPTTGKGPKEWTLTERHLDDLQTDYDTLDVLAECKKALAWAKANPTKRKTANGMPAFLVSWLNKAANGTRPGSPVTARSAPRRPRIDWAEECQQMHGGKCGNAFMHNAKKAYDLEPAQ